MTRFYSSEGIILARRNFGEADRILVVFSRGQGKISLIAKGIRQLKSKKRGSLEVFSQINFQATKTKSIDILTEVEIKNSFLSLRKDLKKVAMAYYFVEVIGRSLGENQKSEKVFDILLESFEELKVRETQLRDLKEKFICRVLVALGFWPKGEKLENADLILEEVLERRVNSARVGKKLFS